MSFIHDLLPGFRILEEEVSREWRRICELFPGHGHKRKHDPEAISINLVGVSIINFKNTDMAFKKTQKVVLTFQGQNAAGQPAPITGLGATISDPSKASVGAIDTTAGTVEIIGVDDGDFTVTPTGTNDKGASITGPAVSLSIADVDTTAVTIVNTAVSDPVDQTPATS